MSSTPIAPFNDATITGVAKAVGELYPGSELTRVLTAARLADVDGETVTKWKRLHSAVANHQNRYRNRQGDGRVDQRGDVAGEDTRSHRAGEGSRDALNQVLSLSALQVDNRCRDAIRLMHLSRSRQSCDNAVPHLFTTDSVEIRARGPMPGWSPVRVCNEPLGRRGQDRPDVRARIRAHVFEAPRETWPRPACVGPGVPRHWSGLWGASQMASTPRTTAVVLWRTGLVTGATSNN